MKKILTLSLCLLILFGCGQEEIVDGKEIYSSASQKMSQLESLTSVTEIKTEFKFSDGDDEEISQIESVTKLSATGLQDGDIDFQMVSNSNFLGEEMKIQQWYIDGVVYAIQDDQSFKFDLNIEDEEDEIIDLDSFTCIGFEDAFDLNAKKSGSKTIVNIVLKPEKIFDILNELELGIDENIINEDSFEMSDIKIIINEDGYFEQQSFSLSFNYDDALMNMDFKIDFSDFDDVTIDEIDKDSFNDINEVLTNTSTYDEELVAKLGEIGYQPYDETFFVKQVDQDVFLLSVQGMFISYNEHMFLINENTYFDGTSDCIFNATENLSEGECDNDALKRAEYLAVEANIISDILD